MFTTWMKFALATARLGQETQEVMALRMITVARGVTFKPSRSATRRHTEIHTRQTDACAQENKEGQPLKSKVEALEDPRSDTPELCCPRDDGSRKYFDTLTEQGTVQVHSRKWGLCQ